MVYIDILSNLSQFPINEDVLVNFRDIYAAIATHLEYNVQYTLNITLPLTQDWVSGVMSSWPPLPRGDAPIQLTENSTVLPQVRQCVIRESVILQNLEELNRFKSSFKYPGMYVQFNNLQFTDMHVSVTKS